MDNKWSGKLLDANGRQGTIEVEPAGESNKQYTWRVLLNERDGTPLEMKGEIAVEFNENQMRMTGKQAFGDDYELEWEMDLTAEKPGLYAKSAMVGQYALRGGPDFFPLTRGVVILWQFD